MGLFFKKKVNPILPTSENDTMTFVQKLDYIEYRVSQLNEKIISDEETLSGLQETLEGTVGDVKDLQDAVAQKSSVSATSSEGYLKTLTVDGTTYNVSDGVGVISGQAQLDVSVIPTKWCFDGAVLTLIPSSLQGSVTFTSNSCAIVFTKDGDNYGGFDGKTYKGRVCWYKKSGSTYTPKMAAVEISVVTDGHGTITFTDGVLDLTTGTAGNCTGGEFTELGSTPIFFSFN